MSSASLPLFDRFDRTVEFAGIEPAKMAAAVALSLLLHLGGYLWWGAPPALRLADTPAQSRKLLHIALVPTAQPSVAAATAVVSMPRETPPRIERVRAAPKPVRARQTSARTQPQRRDVARTAPTGAVTTALPNDMRAASAAATPPQAATGPSVEALRERYLQTLFTHIERHKFYPGAARRQGLEASIQVGFVLDRAGTIRALSISGGPKLLRHATQETLNRALPLPPLPPEVDAPLHVAYRMAFALR